jgi:calcium-dependent protein kinase
VESILSQADLDGNGAIDYTEFIVASMNKKKLLSKKNLKAAFREFDKDGSGTITTEELKVMLGGENVREEVWAELLKEVDDDQNGEVDIKEFQRMMLRIF